MKTKQKPTAVTASSAASSVRAGSIKQRSKEEELAWQRQRQPLVICERERKHEEARREREAQAQAQAQARAQAQAQQKRTSALRRPYPPLTSTRTSATTCSLPKLNTCKTTEQQTSRIGKPVGTPQTKVTVSAAPVAEHDSRDTVPAGEPSNHQAKSDTVDDETAKLRLQLEHLSMLSQKDFEREFRKWMSREGIEGTVHAHLRTDLINSFNTSMLGQMVTRASAAAAQLSQQKSLLLLSPMALSLHTLVAEFLSEQNCLYTLSVFCSEIPHRHALPDFETRPEFRFNEQEMQQVLVAVLGEHRAAQLLQLTEAVQKDYTATGQSLLMTLIKSLVIECASHRGIQEHNTAGTQTEPAACFPSSPDVDTSRLYQAKELVVAADGRTVFMGPRVSQSLNGVEQQLSQLMRQISALCKSCAPPVEIISQQAFEQLLQKEMLERQRLLDAGQTVDEGQTAIKLPDLEKQPEQSVKRQESKTVLSPVGPIQLPEQTPSVPKMPHLHVEQVASLAMVRQALQIFQQEVQPSSQNQDSIYSMLDRLDALVGGLAGCVQTLSNVLNLAMEQEYAVGRHKGFKLGYREGFSHGHYMGVQEGIQCQLKQQAEKQQHDTASQTEAPKSIPLQASACQTKSLSERHTATNTEPQTKSWRIAAVQTDPIPTKASSAVPNTRHSRSYEQWIFEMLHTRSGRIFLERVELSLNKALELQKQRLDELFEVKLRHQAEMMRISRRQTSWRTLCQHVEADAHSAEARELVQKIFQLLEHYEAHHQMLAHKIQQTELAAEETARIQPVWTDTDEINANHIPSSQPMSARQPPATPYSEVRHEAHIPSSQPMSARQPPATPYSEVRPEAHPHNSGWSAETSRPAPGTIYTPAAAAQRDPVPKPPKPRINTGLTDTYSSSRPTTASRQALSVPDFQETLLNAKNRMQQLEQESDQLELSFLNYLERTRNQKRKLKIRATCARERKQIHRTLDSFREWQQRIQSDDIPRTTVLPPPPASPLYSGSELDQESYKFTNAIAVARSKLFTELKGTTSRPATAATGASIPIPPAAPIIPEGERPTLANQQLTDVVQAETEQLLSRVEATLARVSKPPSLQLLTAEAKLDNGLETDVLSTSTLTSQMSFNDDDADFSADGGDGGDEARTPPASRKLQLSLARMHQLFGTSPSPIEPEALLLPTAKAATRPWSAPTSILNSANNAPALVQRPHTAPSSRSEVPAPAPSGAPNLLGLMDALSDVGNTTANSSSLASSPDKQPAALREVYAQLIENASSTSHASSSPSHSMGFWQRMNL